MTLYDSLRRAIDEQEPVALATIVSGPSRVGDKMLFRPDGSTEGALEPPELAPLISADVERQLTAEEPETIDYELAEGSYRVFIDVFPPPARIVIIGATDTAMALTHFAKTLGYAITVIDARAAFAQSERFPKADRVIKGWPQDVLATVPFDARTFVVLLSHDPKFDEPTLDHVLRTEVPYIGVIGSRKTQRERRQRLLDSGFTQADLERLYGPVGLDIGARTPEETALAILGEIAAVRRTKQGGFLRRRLQEGMASGVQA